MSISILIPSYNTPKEYLFECITSIITQDCINKYNFEIIWVNDGSNEQYSLELENSLELFKKNLNDSTRL
jgi:glycosyltransferase involved in cell wall biosynthesis